jgi:hypothetical protein
MPTVNDQLLREFRPPWLRGKFIYGIRVQLGHILWVLYFWIAVVRVSSHPFLKKPAIICHKISRVRQLTVVSRFHQVTFLLRELND